MKDKFITLAELKARPLPKDDEPVHIDPLTGEPRMLGVARAWIHPLDLGRRGASVAWARVITPKAQHSPRTGDAHTAGCSSTCTSHSKRWGVRPVRFGQVRSVPNPVRFGQVPAEPVPNLIEPAQAE